MTRRKAKKSSAKGGAIPEKAEILAFLQGAEGRVGKREIARAFNVRGADRMALKQRLREMAEEGLITRGRKRIQNVGALPPVAVLDIVDQDEDGELVARPANWPGETPPPRVLIRSGAAMRSRGGTLGVGDRLLARIDTVPHPEPDGYPYEARPIRKLPAQRQRLLGIFRALKGGGGVVDPVDKRDLKEWTIAPEDTQGAEEGELVALEIRRSGRFGLPTARITERLGNPEAERHVSLIAIHRHGIPHVFPSEVLEEAEALKAPGLSGREDLRDLPFVTIDPPDARDHDDAVWAAPDDDPKNPNGWVVMVAIADVAHYVRPGTALDREARKRGNSVYFPDRVVPMLPERISADLGSLVAGKTRPCLVVRMVFDKTGRRRDQKVFRALMRSAASLTYAQMQAAYDGERDAITEPLWAPVLAPLWGAYSALAQARDRRQPLALDLPERKVLLDDRGQVTRVMVPERLEAHRLIEEFMIQANVAVAEILSQKRAPIIFRVHDAPAAEKLVAVSDFLASLSLKLPKGTRLTPAHFNRILTKVADSDLAELVNEVILRSQSQAAYSPVNSGHFGLNLSHYVHFTSPIRRYADLMIHRALIRVLGLGEGGMSDKEISRLDAIAEAISDTERRAMAAERETIDRLIARYLAERIGDSFTGRISGVTRSGLFVRLAETGADGFIPASSIGQEYFFYEEGRHALVGEETGETFRLADPVTVRLVEAIPTAGALRFELLSRGRKGEVPSQSRRRRRSSLPPRRRGRRKR